MSREIRNLRKVTSITKTITRRSTRSIQAEVETITVITTDQTAMAMKISERGNITQVVLSKIVEILVVETRCPQDVRVDSRLVGLHHNLQSDKLQICLSKVVALWRLDNRLERLKVTLQRSSADFLMFVSFFYYITILAILPPTGSTSQEMMMAVNELGVIPKKKKFVWTDADENEMEIIVRLKSRVIFSI
jgi:hypothetical protein